MAEYEDLCLRGLLSLRAQNEAEAPALSAPGCRALSYGRLVEQVSRVKSVLRSSGLGKKDRVALVLENGPHMAAALLGVMSSAVAAPLNPRYSAGEFEFYLSDLRTKCLLTQEGLDSPAAAAAGKLGLPILALSPEHDGTAGSFILASSASAGPNGDGFSLPQDLALLLHTSGTTSRPKLVPLTQANICASARNIAASLKLENTDRYLNVMPLFHVHGMIGGPLASLAAGSWIFCSPGFNPAEFFKWLAEFRPTWYTAVPTMHQALVAEAGRPADLLSRHPLRFVRSCSAALPVVVIEELEKMFRAPVVEAYGMTEASHQMSSNPLPPARRKPGSVGIPTGIDMAILDEQGDILPSGTRGEVAIRGASVTSGYEGNPEANERCYTRGWFRTGDQGYFDQDGYLYLTGRLKEIINKGGEKISPHEVDEILLSHPAVAQAVTFALPHPRLGEDVAAAVVLRAGARVSDKDLRQFASRSLAYFKVPSRVVLVDGIPKGPTGKLQRIGLAKALGLEAGRGIQQPRTEMDEQILGVFKDILGAQEEIGVDDNFFQLGGDSLQATQLLSEVENRWGARISFLAFLPEPTVRSLADMIQGHKGSVRPSLVPIRPGGALPPLFLVHPHDGNIFHFYKLAKYLDEDFPLYAFQTSAPDGLDPAPGKIEDLADRYCRELQALLPEGRYFLAGYCFGTWIACEMAGRLLRQNRPPECLVLLDGYAPDFPQPRPGLNSLEREFYRMLDGLRRFRPFLYYFLRLNRKKRIPFLLDLAKRWLPVVSQTQRRIHTASPPSLALPGREQDDVWRYRPPAYPGRSVLIRPSRLPLGFEEAPRLGWERYIQGGLDTIVVPGYHRTLLYEPRVRSLGRKLTKIIRRGFAVHRI